MKKNKNLFLTLLCLAFFALMIYSAIQIWNINAVYQDEDKIHKQVLEYKPAPNPSNKESDNQSIIELQKKYPDVSGWLAIPNTGIDYPFVWYNDNDYYLQRDLNRNYAPAGTIFMDFRCNNDFTSQNTILYGHNMKNDSMFGTVKFFNTKSFFDENKYGTIYLPNKTLTLEFFAYMVLDPNTEKEVYNVPLTNSYTAYVKQNARNWRDVSLNPRDKVVTLSTCSYEAEDARIVLLAKISNTY